MYAILLNFNATILAQLTGEGQLAAPAEAVRLVERYLVRHHGFRSQQNGLFIGGPEVNAVTCVMAAIALPTQFPWFTEAVQQLRLLRIEENNDLMAAIATQRKLVSAAG